MAPRTAIYLARVHIALAALVVIAGLAGGLAVQLELWSPGAQGSPQRYNLMLELHATFPVAIAAATLAGCFGYLAITELAGVFRIPARPVAWLGLGLWVVGLGATIVAVVAAVLRPQDTGWTFYTPEPGGDVVLHPPLARLVGPIAFAASGLVYAGHLGAMVVARWRAIPPTQLAIAAALVLSLAAASIGSIYDTYHPGGEHVLSATAFFAVVLATAAIARRCARGPHGLLAVIAMGAAALWAFTPFRIADLAIVGLWIALAVLGGVLRTVVAHVLLGIAPVLLVHSFARMGLDVDPSELHFHDTYFVVGEYHLLAYAIGFAGIAALHAWGDAIGRVPQPIVSTIAAVVLGAGALFHGVAMLAVGARGMPRRYFDYDPEFTIGHQLTGIGAALVAGGLLLLAIAWLVGHRSRTPGRHPLTVSRQ